MSDEFREIYCEQERIAAVQLVLVLICIIKIAYTCCVTNRHLLLCLLFDSLSVIDWRWSYTVNINKYNIIDV